ncbi:MAG: hypothetical protein JST00_02140 [Deltaproteobacteria bacterium]|nr:hypothetical protein [Deltaproteobacteria bacterium]
MLLLLRDEDVPTVSSAITAIALQHGLVPVDPETEPQDILSVAALLVGPRAVLTPGDDFVVAGSLDTLGVGDAIELGRALSAACSNEVLTIAPTGDGIRVALFDDGDLDEDIRVDLAPPGKKTTSAELAEIAPSEEAEEELREGLSVTNAIELAEHVLRLFGAPPDAYTGPPVTLSFRDPSDDDDA